MKFFEDLTDGHLDSLAAICKLVDFPAQATIFQEHEVAKNVYVIVSGKVSIVICAPGVGCRQMMEAGAGELIGWSPLVHRPRLSAAAVTATPTKLLEFDGKALIKLCMDTPDWGVQVFRRTAQLLAERLSATHVQMFEMSGHHLPKVALESD